VKATDPALNTEAPGVIVISEVTSEVRRFCELRARMRAAPREAPVIVERCEDQTIVTCGDRHG
jgi:hypothetical protein